MRARKAGLFTVMLGALALSFSGQVHAVTPLLGNGMGVVFALTNDLATILALAEVTTGGASGAVRRWAWSVLLLAGGTALGLNTWHAIASRMLPTAGAIAIGAGPVVLAWLLSHLVTLVVVQRRTGQRETPVPAPAAGASTAGGAVRRDAFESGNRDPRAALPEVTRPRPETVPEPLPAERTMPLPALAASRGDGRGSDDLVDRAERLERQELAATGRGISYRRAARRLGVRFDAAKTAVNAARDRIKTAEQDQAA
ncbi:MAG: hypothetical protein ACRDRL_03450 [Sciscionella sp.]